MGKLLKSDMEVEQVICNAHTIHLALCDVFYKKPKDDSDDNQESQGDENENEASGDEEDDAEEADGNDDGGFTIQGQENESVELNPQYKDIIGRVRKVCRGDEKNPKNVKLTFHFLN